MSAPIRVLCVITVRFAENGISAFVMNHYRHMDPKRVHVDFAAPNLPSEAVQQEIAARGGQIHVFPMRNRNPLAYIRKLSDCIRNNRYDIVHAHGNSATLYLEMAAARRGGAMVRIPHSHNTACAMRLADKLLRGAFYRSYTHAFACGEAAGQWLFPHRPFTVAQNAVDAAHYAFDADKRMAVRSACGFADDAFVVAHVGSFNAQKNHAFLIDAFRALAAKRPEARLLLVGGGALMEQARQQAAAYGLSERVCFAGAVPDAAAYLSAADVFALPSNHEGLPFTLIEAQLNGLSCVVSEHVTSEAFLTDTVAVAPLSDGADGWAKRLGEQPLRDRPQACALARAAAEARGFDVRENAERLTELLEQFVAEACPKSVLFVTHKMSGGGCERVIAQLLQRFTEQGTRCTLATECNVPSFYTLPKAVDVISLLDSQTMAASDVPRAYRRLRRVVRERKPDVVLAMPEKVNVWTVLFLLGTGVPVVVSERNDPGRHPKSRIKRLLRRLIYPFAAGFVFQTEQARDCFPRAIRRRGVVLDNPLDIDRLPTAGVDRRTRTVVGAGRLDGQKNFPLLIRAFAAFRRTHPDWTLRIYGEGAARAALQRLMDESLPRGAAELAGQTDDLPAKLRSCGVFALSSDFEGMPNALIEAMATGTACVATDCPVYGVRALVNDGENGLLVPVGDEAALTRALCTLADDEAQRERLGTNAAVVRVRLDDRTVAEKWRRYLGQSRG